MTYETIEGTQPHEHAKHEPRTVVRKDGEQFHMMTEIGDGVFVAWTNCRKCSALVKDCTCAGGPVEAEFMARWRNERFERELNARPDVEYHALDKVIETLEGYGYRVTRIDESIDESDEAADPASTPVDTTGLDQALAQVKAMREGRDLADIEVDF